MSYAPATAFAWAWETDDEDGGGSVDVVDLGRASPELVLVSPDLRRAALALLPERDPDGWIPRPYPVPPAAIGLLQDETPILAEPRDGTGELVGMHASPTGRALVAAAVVYAGQCVVGAALAGGALVGATVALAGLADVLHP